MLIYLSRSEDKGGSRAAALQVLTGGEIKVQGLGLREGRKALVKSIMTVRG